jgi:methyl coenzyme M reductase subunit C
MLQIMIVMPPIKIERFAQPGLERRLWLPTSHRAKGAVIGLMVTDVDLFPVEREFAYLKRALTACLID